MNKLRLLAITLFAMLATAAAWCQDEVAIDSVYMDVPT